MTATKPQFS